MNWDRIEGNWKEYKGKVRERWGKLTDDDLNVIKGKRDQLVGKLQQVYSIARDKAEDQVKEFEQRLSSAKPGKASDRSEQKPKTQKTTSKT